MNRLLDLLFPPKCIFCHKLLRNGERDICAACQNTLPENNRTKDLQFTEGCVAPLFYTDTVRTSVLRYKFQGCSFYAETYGRMMAEILQDCPAEVVTWIPVDGIRRLTRGYDQAELLAREVAQRLGLPCEKLLIKRRRAKQSRQKSAAIRRANVSGAFLVYPEHAAQGKHILLIDDICTTGSTMTEAAMTLRFAGAEKIHCAVLAHTKLEERR